MVMLYITSTKNRNDEVICTLCGKGYKYILVHVKSKHGFTSIQYKMQNNYHPNKSFISSKFKKHLSNKAKNRETNYKNFQKGVAHRFQKGNKHTPTAYLRKYHRNRLQQKWILNKCMKEYFKGGTLEQFTMKKFHSVKTIT